MNKLDSEVRADNKLASDWLLHYHQRKQDYLDIRDEILNQTPKPPENSTGGPGGYQSDTTGQRAVRLAQYENDGSWLKVIEEVEVALPNNLQIYLEIKREYRFVRGRRGHRGWVTGVQRRYADKTGRWIEAPRTFLRWWDRIIEYTVRTAAKKGLL